MKFTRRKLWMLLLFAFLLTFTGCSKKSEGDKAPLENETETPGKEESASALPLPLSGKGDFTADKLTLPDIPEPDKIPDGFELFKPYLSEITFPDPSAPGKAVCIIYQRIGSKEKNQVNVIPYFYHLIDGNWSPVAEKTAWAAASKSLFSKPVTGYQLSCIGSDKNGNLYYSYSHNGMAEHMDERSADTERKLFIVSKTGEVSSVDCDAGKDSGIGPLRLFTCGEDMVLGQINKQPESISLILYGFDPTGKLLFSTETDWFSDILVWKDKIAMFHASPGESEIVLLDKQTGKEAGRLDTSDISGSGNSTICLYNDDVLCLSGSAGLYALRYGTETWEQILDSSAAPKGNLMSFPDSLSFLTIYYQSAEYYLYRYDESSSSNAAITVFALPDTDASSPLRKSTLQYAAQEYMLKHPDVSIRITTAQADSSETTEDSIKALNTRLLAGEGEDILLLDGLPYGDLIEKGCLADLSALAAECSLSPQSLTHPFTAGDKIYGLPARITVPVLQGDAQDLAGVTDLSSLSAAVQRKRTDSPETSPFYLDDPYILAEAFYPVCAPAWMNEEGQFQENTFQEYLEAVASFAAAAGGRKEKAGNSDDWSGQIPYSLKDGSNHEGKPRPVYYVTGLDYPIFFFADYAYLTYDRGMDTREKRFETFLLRPGQVSGAYLPSRIFAVNKNSKNTEAAEAFIRYVLTDPDIQTAEIYDGLPVTEDGLRKFFEPYLLSEGFGFADDKFVKLKEEDLDSFVDWCRVSLTTPCVLDSRLSGIILPEVKKYLEGAQSLSQTVTQVKQKVSISIKE